MMLYTTSCFQFKGLQHQCYQTSYGFLIVLATLKGRAIQHGVSALNIDLTILANSVFFSILSYLCGRHERLVFQCTKLFLLVPPFSLLFWTLLVHPFLKIFSSIWAGVPAEGRKLNHHKTVLDNFNKYLGSQTTDHRENGYEPSVQRFLGLFG